MRAAFWPAWPIPRAAAIGNRARELAETKYSYAAYLDKTRQACDALFPAPPAGDGVKDVA
jgi:hypothetical protein